MTKLTTISPTQISLFDCCLAWYWGHVKGYVPIKKAIALELGLGVHYALEQYYSKGLDPVKVFIKWAVKGMQELDASWSDDVAALLSAKTLGVAMLKGYLEEYHGKEPFTVLKTEHTMSRRLPSLVQKGRFANCEVTARIDTLVRDTVTQKLFILEHKTFTQFNPDQLERDHQLCAQVWVAQEDWVEPIEGVIYNGLRKQIPSSKTRLNLFERHYVYINEHQLAAFVKRAYWTYRRMTSPDLTVFPQPDVVRCAWCAFKEPCTVYMKGGDYKFILNNLYTKREKRSG